MSGPVDRIDEAIRELRYSLVGLDGRSQLKLLNESTAAAARLRVEIDGMRHEALDRLVRDIEHESAMDHPA